MKQGGEACKREVLSLLEILPININKKMTLINQITAKF